MILPLCCAFTLLGPGDAPATDFDPPTQVTAVQPTRPPAPAAFPASPVWTIRPAAEPVPALKYRLAPERVDLRPGNAALPYYRAALMLIQARAAEAAERKPDGKPEESIDMRVGNLRGRPLADTPRDEARKLVDRHASVLREVEVAVRRQHCDWEMDDRDEGFNLLLPEVQEMRTLARINQLQTRLAVLDGRIEDAVHNVQSGMIMARHTGHGSTLIQSLVGIAMAASTAANVEDMIQAADVPNLYWMLASRPRPFIDLGPAFEGERRFVEREVPSLRDLEGGIWSVDRARQFAAQVEQRLFPLMAGEPVPGTNAAVPPSLPGLARRLGLAAMCVKVYPESRLQLIAEGMPEAQVDAMPVVQASALATYRTYRRSMDDFYKWMDTPYWQSHNGGDTVLANRTVEQKLANPLLAILQSLLPALNASRVAATRLERRLDALQTVEAIRLYAHQHGKLPATLAETGLPIPVDPATNRPFDYKLDGDVALLSAPVPPGFPNHVTSTVDIRLKLAR